MSRWDKHQEKEVVIIHLENKGVRQLQYLKMNLLKEFM